MGDFDFAKPAKKKGAGDSKVPAPVVKAIAKKADKGGKFDPSVFLTSGVPSTGTGPTSGSSPSKRAVDGARSKQKARQAEMRGKTVPKASGRPW